ncbi:lamin tail domain-containing protein [Streptomyces sp. NPDC001828]|uniref:lamin tail domain-containing protein n=1 Tax=Streptomyces sp. NPDC001828 TaxID=3364615 RepID=UPI00368F1C7A
MSSRTITRIAARGLAATGLAAAAAIPASAAAKPPVPRSPIVLGAIQYDSPGREDGSQRSLNAEWVTVTNTGRGAVNLKGWTLTGPSRHTYTFHNLRLRPPVGAGPHRDRPRDRTRRVPGPPRLRVEQHRRHRHPARHHQHIVAAKSWGRR